MTTVVEWLDLLHYSRLQLLRVHRPPQVYRLPLACSAVEGHYMTHRNVLDQTLLFNVTMLPLSVSSPNDVWWSRRRRGNLEAPESVCAGGGSQRAEVSSGRSARNFGTDQFVGDHSRGHFTQD